MNNNIQVSKHDIGKCSTCDWRGSAQGSSARGKIIDCEWFGSSKVVQEMENCSGWTSNLRFPNETRVEFISRQNANRLDTERHQLVLRAHRRAIFALIISLLTLLVSIAKVIIDFIVAK